MSFINWGHETPEQREARLRAELADSVAIEEALRHRRSSHDDIGKHKFLASKGKGKAKAKGGGSAEDSE